MRSCVAINIRKSFNNQWESEIRYSMKTKQLPVSDICTVRANSMFQNSLGALYFFIIITIKSRFIRCVKR